ncbi:hypothetical protein D3C73_1520730 [compost metagenome]
MVSKLQQIIVVCVFDTVIFAEAVHYKSGGSFRIIEEGHFPIRLQCNVIYI